MALRRRWRRAERPNKAEAAVDPAVDQTATVGQTAGIGAEPAEGTGEAPFGVDPADTFPVNWEERYLAEHAAFEEYRAGIIAADERRRKEDAYRALLRDAGIPERKRDAVLRLADLDALVLDENGVIEGADALCADIREEWREIIPSVREVGAQVARSPMRFDRTLTKESIMAIRDRDERRAAIAENMELFR